MNSSSLSFNGGFTITGGQIDRKMLGAFTVTWVVKELTVEKFGYDPNEEDPNDISITGVFGNTGKIEEKQGYFVQPVPNAIITVWKDGCIVDRVKTDLNGEYTIFVPSGIYDIEIDGHGTKRMVRNYEIKNGITEVYCKPVMGDIFEKYHDVVSFLKEDEFGTIGYENDWFVHGEILDKEDNPIQNCEIIVSVEDEAVVYLKTNEEGKYSFMLPLGKYDVRIKAPKQHVKIAKDVIFGGRDGFMPKVAQLLRTVN